MGDRIKVGFQLFVELEENSEKIHNIIDHQTNLEPSKLFLFQNHECTKTRGGHSYRLKNISFPAIGCLILSAIEQLIAGMH